MTKPTLLDPASCTCANLRMAARTVTQAYDEALRPYGLKTTQFTLLATLSECGDLPLTKLAQALGLDRTTLTRNLKPLIAKAWIADSRDEDHRVRLIGLTPAGKRMLGLALPLWRAAQSGLAENLGSKRWSRLLGDLSKTRAAAQGR